MHNGTNRFFCKANLGKSIARLKLVQLRLCKIRLTFGKRRSKNLAGGHEQSTEPGEWAKLGTRTLTKLVSLARNAVTWCLKHSVLKHDLFIPICSLGCAKVFCVFQNGIWQRLSLSSGLQLAESSWGASTVSAPKHQQLSCRFHKFFPWCRRGAKPSSSLGQRMRYCRWFANDLNQIAENTSSQDWK